MSGSAPFNRSVLCNAILSVLLSVGFCDRPGRESGDDSFCRVNGEHVIMDAETKEKLTELQHQYDLLKTEVEANMKTMRAQNESAIDRLLASNEKAIGGLRTDFEKLRTTVEGNSRTLLLQIMGLLVVAVGIIGALIKFL